MNLIINKNRAISSFYYEYEKYFFSNLFTYIFFFFQWGKKNNQ